MMPMRCRGCHSQPAGRRRSTCGFLALEGTPPARQRPAAHLMRLVTLVERVDDRGGDAAAIRDLQALAPGPFADGLVLLPTRRYHRLGVDARGARPRSPTRAASSPGASGVCNMVGEGGPQRLRVSIAEVDLVGQSIPNSTVSSASAPSRSSTSVTVVFCAIVDPPNRPRFRGGRPSGRTDRCRLTFRQLDGDLARYRPKSQEKDLPDVASRRSTTFPRLYSIISKAIDDPVPLGPRMTRRRGGVNEFRDAPGRQLVAAASGTNSMFGLRRTRYKPSCGGRSRGRLARRRRARRDNR